MSYDPDKSMKIIEDDVWYDTEPFGSMRYYNGKGYFFDGAYIVSEDGYWRSSKFVVYCVDNQNNVELIKVIDPIQWTYLSVGIEIYNDKIFVAFMKYASSDTSYKVCIATMDLNGENYSEHEVQSLDSRLLYGVRSTLDEDNGLAYFIYTERETTNHPWRIIVGECNIQNGTYQIHETGLMNESVHHWANWVVSWQSESLVYNDNYLFITSSIRNMIMEGGDDWTLNIWGFKFHPDGSNYLEVKMTDLPSTQRYPSIYISGNIIYHVWDSYADPGFHGVYSKTDLNFNNYEVIYATNPEEDEPFSSWPNIPLVVRGDTLYSLSWWTTGYEISLITINLNDNSYSFATLVNQDHPNWPEEGGYCEDYHLVVNEDGSSMFYYWHGYYDETYNHLNIATGVYPAMSYQSTCVPFLFKVPYLE